jgi:hypothetical protein
MKIKLLLCFVFCQLFSLAAFSQAPGYLGKNFSAGLEATFSPQLEYYLTDIHYKRKVGFRPGITVDYVISRNKSVGLGLYQINRMFDFSENVTYDVSFYQGNQYQGLSFYSHANGTIKSFAFSANMKFFSNTHLAPLGWYSKFELTYFRSKVSYDTTAVLDKGFFSYQGVQVAPKYAMKDAYNNLAVGFAYGWQGLFMDQIILNLAGQIGWLLTNSKDTFSVWDSKYLTESNYLQSRVGEGLNLQYMLGIQVGVSYLIF